MTTPFMRLCFLLVYLVNRKASFVLGDRGARVVLPARADSLGHVISNDLTVYPEENGEGLFPSDARQKRHASTRFHASDEETSSKSLYVVIHDEEEEILLKLTPNTKLVSPLTVIEWFYEDGRHVVKRMKENCFYSGKDVRAKGHSLVAVSNCDGLVGYIQTNNESYFIEPLTNELRKKLLESSSQDSSDKSGDQSRYQTQQEQISGFDRWSKMENTFHDGPRPHLIYKVDSILDKLNLSADQDFDMPMKDTRKESEKKQHSVKSNSVKPLKGSARFSRSLDGLDSKYLKGGRRTYPWKRNSEVVAEYDDNNNYNAADVNESHNTPRANIEGRAIKGGKRRKRNGCKKMKKSQNLSKNSVGNFDHKNLLTKEEEKCLTKKEKRERRREMREKRRTEREKRRREKEEKRKLREKRKKKQKKSKTYSDKQPSSVVDPLQGEEWEGYSPDLLWETQVAPGPSGLTEYDFGEVLNQTDPQKWLELTVGVDYTVIDFHGEDQVEKYIFTLFNIVSAIYEDPSLQANLDLVLLRLIFYKDKSHSQVKEGLAKRSLEAVNRWAETLHRLSSSHLKHDLAVWLTRLDLGGPSGYAPVSGVCDPSRSCTLNRDEGLTSAFIIAHEMGHVLGMSHDGDTAADNTCEPEGRLGSVMAPLVAATFGRFHWSKCSRKEYHSAKSWSCLQNKPEWENATVMSSSIQFQYSLDDQCRMEFGEGFGLCRTFGMSDPCTFLWCSNASTPHLCKTKKGPPLEGTVCGPKMWCRHGFCEKVRESEISTNEVDAAPEPSAPKKNTPIRHNPQHGGWSTWTEWGSCSRTCGTGMMFRTRECNNPVPRWGGRLCPGKREEWKICSPEACSHPTDLRAEQCKILGKLVRLGKRRSKLSWFPYEAKRRRKKCRMTCVSHDTNEIYMGREFVVDGTQCSYGDPHSVCVQGKCIPLGCDSVVNSPARIDECGVCRGNGSACRRTTLIFTGTPDPQYSEVAQIPEGAWKITVREDSPTSNFLSLRDNSSVLVLNAQRRQEPERQFISEGAMFHYQRSGDKESMTASGPLIRPVTVMVHGGLAREKITISTTYLTKEDTRDFYHWVLGALSPCSASCGGGKQTEAVSCKDMRTNKEVDTKFCDHLSRPKPKFYPCNMFGCEVRWIAGPWEHCTATCGQHGIQHRQVSCVRVNNAEQGAVRIPVKRNVPTIMDGEDDALDDDVYDDEYKEYYYDDVSEGHLDLGSHEVLTLFESPFTDIKDKQIDYYYGGSVEEGNTNFNLTAEIDFSPVEFDYVDPSLCRGEREPLPQRPCNRLPCPSYWKPQGWTQCSVTCGMGQQEVILSCSNENDVGTTAIQDCGKRPREVRACYKGECLTDIKNNNCTKDDSAFCQLSTLHRYCKIPKYYNLCCFTCFKVLKKQI